MKNRIKHILLIDDDEDDCTIFRDALDQLGTGVQLSWISDTTKFESVKQGLRPDVIFLDINMPGKDGFHWMREFAADNYFHGIPVVFYSNSSRPSDVQQAFEMGATLYFKKPSSYTNLLLSIETILEFNWEEPLEIRQKFYQNNRYEPMTGSEPSFM